MGFFQTIHGGDWSQHTSSLSLFVIATTAVLLWRTSITSTLPASSKRRKSRAGTDSSERNRLREQLAIAASSRVAQTKNSSRRDRSPCKVAGRREEQRAEPPAPRKSKNDSTTTTTKQTTHQQQQQQHQQQHQLSIGPRQATLAEQVRYREERASLEQFGFSIYGNTDYCVDCVPASTSNITSGHTASTGGGSTFGLGIHAIAAIPDLPGSAQVYKELERLRDEFDPICQARGWKVLALTELCCCGDGDETLFHNRTSGGSNLPKPDTVMGYCVGPTDNRLAVGIHIRCRIPGSCRDGLRLYPYAELVQTMCHELAHIQVGVHNDRFYKLMKDLEDEYHRKRLQHPWGTGRRLGR